MKLIKQVKLSLTSNCKANIFVSIEIWEKWNQENETAIPECIQYLKGQERVWEWHLNCSTADHKNSTARSDRFLLVFFSGSLPTSLQESLPVFLAGYLLSSFPGPCLFWVYWHFPCRVSCRVIYRIPYSDPCWFLCPVPCRVPYRAPCRAWYPLPCLFFCWVLCRVLCRVICRVLCRVPFWVPYRVPFQVPYRVLAMFLARILFQVLCWVHCNFPCRVTCQVPYQTP